MRILGVERLNSQLETIMGSRLHRIVPEKGQNSSVAVSNEGVDILITPQTDVVETMTIAVFGSGRRNPRHFGLILSEKTNIRVMPDTKKPTQITVEDPYNGQAVTIFKGGRVTSRRIDVRV